AAATLTTALASRGQSVEEARLALALLKGRRSHYTEAEQIAAQVAASTKDPRLEAGARGAIADAKLFNGEYEAALALMKQLRAKNNLADEQLGHMALAAQLSSEFQLADELMVRRLEIGATAEDMLIFAQIH